MYSGKRLGIYLIGKYFLEKDYYYYILKTLHLYANIYVNKECAFLPKSEIHEKNK